MIFCSTVLSLVVREWHFEPSDKLSFTLPCWYGPGIEQYHCSVRYIGWWLRHFTLSLPLAHSISHRICTQFCCVLFCCGYIHWYSYPYPSGLLYWHWGNHMIAPVPVKQPWRIWVNKSHESTTHCWCNQDITKPLIYFMGHHHYYYLGIVRGFVLFIYLYFSGILYFLSSNELKWTLKTMG